MRFTPRLPLALAGIAMLSACGSTSLFNRDRPDEMAVSRQPPLVIPPDFALTPPTPGTAASQQDTLQRNALEAMFGGAAPRSTSETSTLNRAGGPLAEVGIRSSVGDTQTEVVDKGATTQDIIAAPEGDGQFAKVATGQ